MSHGLFVHRTSSALIAITTTVFPEGRFWTLVNLSQSGTDLIICSAMLIPIKRRQSMCNGEMGLWHARGECGLGSE